MKRPGYRDLGIANIRRLDRTNGRAYGTINIPSVRLSVRRLSSVCRLNTSIVVKLSGQVG